MLLVALGLSTEGRFVSLGAGSLIAEDKGECFDGSDGSGPLVDGGGRCEDVALGEPRGGALSTWSGLGGAASSGGGS